MRPQIRAMNALVREFDPFQYPFRGYWTLRQAGKILLQIEQSEAL